jgi:hypothetical protein
MSPYCSAECGREAQKANMKARGRRPGWGTEGYVPPANEGAAEKRHRPLAMFAIPGIGDFDWRDAQMNPMG